MDLRYKKIDDTNDAVFHLLMVDYYRDGEDRDTPLEEIDSFIQLLFGQIMSNAIKGCLAYSDCDTAVGFVLWMKDRPESDFSEMPGYGTILEIGLARQYRKHGMGKEIVRFAEEQMKNDGVDGFYVLAYGPAQDFWARCGYANSHRSGANKLPIFMKEPAKS